MIETIVHGCLRFAGSCGSAMPGPGPNEPRRKKGRQDRLGRSRQQRRRRGHNQNLCAIGLGDTRGGMRSTADGAPENVKPLGARTESLQTGRAGGILPNVSFSRMTMITAGTATELQGVLRCRHVVKRETRRKNGALAEVRAAS